MECTVAEGVTRFSMHAVLCRVLTGGTTTCDVFSGADYYGKLAVVRAAACRDDFVTLTACKLLQ